MTRATVVLPTTGARAAVLPYALASVLGQTLADFELFVIGDGAAEGSRAVIEEVAGRDPRLRFFDFPKGAGRGEDHRHRALREARGRFVCYLCDRDLYLPWHLETLDALLADADFAHPLRFHIDPRRGLRCVFDVDYAHPGDRGDLLHRFRTGNGAALSLVGHRLELYRRLPDGWQRPPPGLQSDIHMWRRLLALPGCRARSGTRPSVLSFHSFLRPGWTIADRAAELARWSRRLAAPGAYEGLLEELVAALQDELVRRGRRERSPLLSWLRRSWLADRTRASPLAGPARRAWQALSRALRG